MNKSYVIAPLILLSLFGFRYYTARQEMEAKEVMQQKAADEIKAAEAKRKAEIDARANADAKKRQDERETADRAKEAKKKKDYDDAMKRLNDEANDYAAQAAKLSKESADLEAGIAQTRADRERINRETLDLSKEVEQAKINRRVAELEIQRMVDMVAKRLSDSSMTVAPPPPLLPVTK